MTHKNLSCSEKPPAYPGNFIHTPLKLEELMAELLQPHEVESRLLVNIAEHSNAFIIEVAAPGMKRGDFYLSINEDVLTISVLRKKKDAVKKLYHQHEFYYGCFTREIVLPGNVDADFLRAVYEDGVLCVAAKKESIRNELCGTDYFLLKNI